MIDIFLEKLLHVSDGTMNLTINCKLPESSFTALYGESGAGKTCTLRMLAGLLKPDQGRIIADGTCWYDHSKRILLKPQQRRIGFVFQNYALFPNMTVRENLTYALKDKRNQTIIEELIEIIDLGKLQNRRPETLSGGQKQRVALARSLVNKPQLLMLDEPLSAIDPAMRIRLQDYLQEVHRQYKLTTILVSHNLAEIFKLADQVLVLKNGRIVRKGKPVQVFSNKRISGKFQFTGEIVDIAKEDVIYVVSVLIGNDLVKVIADLEEIQELDVGSKVLVASKAFNPLIQKII